MLSKEDFAVIKALNKRGVYHKDIAEQLGVHPRTVSNSNQNRRQTVWADKGGSVAGESI